MTEPMKTAAGKKVSDEAIYLANAFSPFLIQNGHRNEITKNIAKSIQSFADQQVAAERERIRNIARYYVHKDDWTKFEKEIDSL